MIKDDTEYWEGISESLRVMGNNMLTLESIGGGYLLDRPAAESYLRLSEQLGKDIPLTGPLAAFRTYAQQAYLYRGWITHQPGFNFALPPGTSVHELGNAIDVVPPEWPFMDSIGESYGWIKTNPAEQWHHEYEIALDTHLGDDMALTDADVQKVADAVWAHILQGSEGTTSWKQPASTFLINTFIHSNRLDGILAGVNKLLGRP